MPPSPTAVPTTETADQRYRGLDTWPDLDVLGALLDGQARAIEAVRPALPALAVAAELAALKLASGGRLIYLGAGTPALISLGDALEVPQTYGIPRDRVLVILAGGKGIVENLNGPEEDDGPLARIKVAEAGVGPGDCVIATSASGSTPYTVSGLTAAREAGAATIGVAGNPGAPLFDVADVSVLIEAGPEVISGSTRLGAGTAQKAALNLFSTLLGVKLGHVHDGLMVNMVADNAKLRKRAARIVAQVTGVALPQAEAALSETDGAVKPAILIAAGAAGYDAAIASLQAAGGNVRAALIALAH